MTNADRTEMELAGVTNAFDGGFDRLFPLEEWAAPGRVALVQSPAGEIQLEADYESSHAVAADRTLLTSFLKMRSSPEEVLRFATRWGLLGAPDYEESHRQVVAANREGRPGVRREPLQRWIDYADKLTALLKGAALLRNGKPVPAAVHSAAVHRPDPDEQTRPEPLWAFASQKGELSEELNKMMRRLGIIPAIAWGSSEPQPRMRMASQVPSSLLSALVYRTALAFCGAEEIPVCDGCRRMYEVGERRPKAGQRQFCPECRSRGVPKLFATRDARNRKKQLQHDSSAEE